MQKWKLIIAIITLLMIPSLILGAVLLYEHAAKPQSKKVGFYVIDHAFECPNPPDSSIPKERTIAFLGQSYPTHYFASTEINGIFYDSYHGEVGCFLINRETGVIVQFFSQKDNSDNSLTKDELRKLAQVHASTIAEENLGAYTVTDRWWGRSSCSHGANTGFNHYVSIWLYGSENPVEIAQKSFAIEITAATGRVVKFERPEYWATHDSDLCPHAFPNDTFVQLSTNTPFPELPEISQLVDLFYPDKSS